jgi:hypothetical protein
MKSTIFALLAASAAAFPIAALAQQQLTDPAFLQRALTAMQVQRNQAMDAAAGQQARADGLQEDLNKARAKIKELEPKPDAPATSAPADSR